MILYLMGNERSKIMKETNENPKPTLTDATCSGLGGATLLRGRLKEGQCAECAVVHDPAQPHNQESLFWQYQFREKHGRWPTWADALAHCSKEVKAFWVKALAELGIKV